MCPSCTCASWWCSQEFLNYFFLVTQHFSFCDLPTTIFLYFWGCSSQFSQKVVLYFPVLLCISCNCNHSLSLDAAWKKREKKINRYLSHVLGAYSDFQGSFDFLFMCSLAIAVVTSTTATMCTGSLEEGEERKEKRTQGFLSHSFSS